MLTTVMVGHDGHRGWTYYLAVDPDHRGLGVGRQAVVAAKHGFPAAACPRSC